MRSTFYAIMVTMPIAAAFSGVLWLAATKPSKMIEILLFFLGAGWLAWAITCALLGPPPKGTFAFWRWRDA